ncbi:MAG: glycosyltransferase family 1 protein [Candidatus Electrothrix sp. AR5]|nr:glycosyltransferase family 1 protein [Candidatus Electrothrix sp. AR5]
MRVNFLLIQTSVGDYRQQVLSLLKSKLKTDFQVRCGKNYFYPSLKTGVNIGSNLVLIKNRFLFNRRFLWQSDVIWSGIRTKNIILEFNPRILSNWIILIFRFILGKKTALWGHAWSRSGQQASTEWIRKIMRIFADTIIVYTEKQKKELQSVDIDRKVIAAPNSIYRREEMYSVGDHVSRKSFIYVGRLVPEKKVQLLINAFSVAELDNSYRLLIVGSGPDEAACKALTERKKITHRVEFLGHVSDIERIRNLYALSLASVSPGYAGLSITQSISFGIPIIIADDEPHAPEIEAAIPNVNCIFFRSNNVNDLSRVLLSVANDKEYWIGQSGQIVKNCQQKYSVELMCERLLQGFMYE